MSKLSGWVCTYPLLSLQEKSEVHRSKAISPKSEFHCIYLLHVLHFLATTPFHYEHSSDSLSPKSFPDEGPFIDRSHLLRRRSFRPPNQVRVRVQLPDHPQRPRQDLPHILPQIHRQWSRRHRRHRPDRGLHQCRTQCQSLGRHPYHRLHHHL